MTHNAPPLDGRPSKAKCAGSADSGANSGAVACRLSEPVSHLRRPAPLRDEKQRVEAAYDVLRSSGLMGSQSKDINPTLRLLRAAGLISPI